MTVRQMVNLTKINPLELAQATGVPAEDVERVVQQIIMDKENQKRHPKPPVPEGGISLRGASRKYGIPHPTLSIWVKKNYIPILLRTKNELYIDEIELATIATIYSTNPGQGKNTIKKIIKQS